MGAEQTVAGGLATPEKSLNPSGRQRGTRRGGKATADRPAKRQRSGHSRAPAASSTEEGGKVAKGTGKRRAAATKPKEELLRLLEPGVDHPALQLTGHLPGSRRIPAWMQVYSSAGCRFHQDQPTYSSSDGKYLLYCSSGPGVGQGWWLGRTADGTASDAALAFLPNGHSDWWVLDKGAPQQAEIIITTASLPEPKPQAPVLVEEEACDGGSNGSQTSSSSGELRLAAPGAGHPSICLTGHLPGENCIPAWMQVYSCADPSAESSYTSQDGKYLLYQSSGPGVAEGWWLGHASDGESSQAALAFLPSGHEEWWVLEQGAPRQAEVIITTHESPAVEAVGPIDVEETTSVSSNASELEGLSRRTAVAEITAAVQETGTSDDASMAEPPAVTEPDSLLSRQSAEPAPHGPTSNAESSAQVVLPLLSSAGSDLQPPSASLTHKGSGKESSEAANAKASRTMSAAESQAPARRIATPMGALGRSASYSNSLDRIARSVGRSASSTNTVERMSRDFRDASDSISRIAGPIAGIAAGCSGSARNQHDTLSEVLPQRAGHLAAPDSILRRRVPTPARADRQMLAPPRFEADQDGRAALPLARNGVCIRDLDLVIAPVSERESFLDEKSLKRQDKLLKRFQRILSMNLGATAGSFARAPEPVAAM